MKIIIIMIILLQLTSGLGWSQDTLLLSLSDVLDMPEREEG